MAQASGKPYSEPDVHVIRRLESFSDVVIGFALAQTAYNLVIPKHPLDILTNQVGLFAYFATFALVATIWWSNSRLFQHYFVPNRLTYFLSLVMLALTGLLVYALQVWMHTVSTNDSYSAAQIYFGILALTYIVLALLFVVGLIRYRGRLAHSVHAAGLIRCAWLLCVGLGAGLGALMSAIPGWSLAAHHVSARLVIGEDQGPVPAEAIFGVMLGMLIASVFGIIVRIRSRRMHAA